MRALSIRQPYAELILRGIKPIEFRSRPTRIIGERFYIYAAKQWAAGKLFLAGCGKPEIRNQKSESSPKPQIRIVGDNIEVPAPPDGPEPWMIELAKMLILKDLPTGVIVGTARIARCVEGERSQVTGQKSDRAILTSDLRPLTSLYEWHLTDVERAKKLRKPKGHPQPVWFTPF
jgi:hypothetical protein